MQENTRPRFELNAIEDTLLTRDYLAAKKRVNNLDEEARYRARKIISDAWRESEEIKDNAFHDGFEMGLIYCIEHIAGHFKDVAREHARLQAVLQHEIEAAMQATLRDNTLFLNLVIEWVKINSVNSGDNLIISLPQHQKHLAAQLCSKLRSWLLTEPQIVFHQYDFYQVKFGDQLMEFNADEFTAGLVRRLVDNNEDIEQRIRKISSESLEKLRALF
ncbi:hypothetical protein [Pantoea sp. B65]|uniref:hypothetical protein n=1 Tax=Pantoea sp. B65 TaxID=2813359 RepID=UPI0039B63380